MLKKLKTYLSDLLVSGHSFEKEEVLLKFQYKVINTILFVMASFTFIFAVLSSLGLNPLGEVQTIVNYGLVISAVIIVIRLRGDKSRYLQSAYLMYSAAFMNFVSALLFVPHDEFRIIWFYLLVFAAYITGGVRAGNIVSIFSIITVMVSSAFYELYLSQAAIVSSILGLIIASLFIRAYTKKIIDFEREITEHERVMLTQSRLAAMGEMMSMIAHQWRQPLSTTTLMITNERFKSMVAGKEPSECDEILEKISDTMIYLSDTIDDFQTYFKPGKVTEEIAVYALIERVRHFTKARLLQAKVQLHNNACENELIKTYPNEVVQVLINIINNAADVLMEKNSGERNIWMRTRCDESNVMISIEDNGGGIDKDIIEKIFEPYFSTKSKNGTGLGLYMSMMIIGNYVNGSLDVVNTENGACFTVTLAKNNSL